ncbi:MAG: DUF4214 domain-containing protein [Lachnospiraceae bacterium]|nr:DUF4214 domain-containing protein [Lachnospiraceae bacterium]
MRKRRLGRWMRSVLAAMLAVVMTLSLLPAQALAAPAEKADAKEQIEAFIIRMYRNTLDREPDADGLAFWVDLLTSGTIDGANTAAGFINSPEFQAKGLDDEAFLTVMYDAFFGREADAEGWDFWLGLMQSGYTRGQVLSGFVNLPEFTGLCEQFGILRGMMDPEGNPYNAGITRFVSRLYTKCLGRPAESEGLYYWVQMIATGQFTPMRVATKEFFFSDEFQSKERTDAEYLEVLYQTFFDRGSDAEGLAYWQSWLDQGIPRSEIIYGFANSNEFHAVMDDCGLPFVIEHEFDPKVPSKNAYDYTSTLRGLQGDNTSYEHGFWNVVINEYIGGGTAYEFEGQTYQFNYLQLKNLAESVIIPLNNQKKTVNMVFLLRLTSGQEYLVDEGSRTAGYAYYMPATTGAGRQTLRAFWSWFSTTLAAMGGRIDNYIYGNEANSTFYCYESSFNAGEKGRKYGVGFYDMYEQVMASDPDARCSIAIDHSWNLYWAPESVLPARDFLGSCVNYLNTKGDVKWYISTHLYPVSLDNASVWWGSPDAVQSDDTHVFDASNLRTITEYIKNVYGPSHRIMLTEQGFTRAQGAEIQAASLAYAYYAAKYNDMVDCFIINTENAGGALDFRLTPTAQQVWDWLEDGNQQHKAWIDNTCLQTIGISSWNQVIPNYAG